MNKNIYFKGGLSPFQLLGVGALLLILFLMNIILAFVMLIPIYFLVRYIGKQNKSGNPNFLDTLLVKNSSPEYIKDEGDVMRGLKPTK